MSSGEITNESLAPFGRGLAQYHSNETLAMLQRYHQIEHLIGLSHHSLTEGNHCENLVRAFLRETLPSRYSVDTGFILGAPASIPWFPFRGISTETVSVSPQLDVIIHDTQNYAPVLRTGEFVIVLPDAVHGIIEVKKTLTSASLQSALRTLAESRLLVRHSQGIRRLLFASVFAFGADEDLVPRPPQISMTYENRYREICNSFTAGHAVPDLLIVALHLFLGCLDEDRYPVRVGWGLTNQHGVNISGQLLLWYLMRSLRLPEVNARVGRFEWPEGLEICGEFCFESPRMSENIPPDPISQ